MPQGQAVLQRRISATLRLHTAPPSSRQDILMVVCLLIHALARKSHQQVKFVTHPRFASSTAPDNAYLQLRSAPPPAMVTAGYWPRQFHTLKKHACTYHHLSFDLFIPCCQVPDVRKGVAKHDTRGVIRASYRSFLRLDKLHNLFHSIRKSWSQDRDMEPYQPSAYNRTISTYSPAWTVCSASIVPEQARKLPFDRTR